LVLAKDKVTHSPAEGLLVQ